MWVCVKKEWNVFLYLGVVKNTCASVSYTMFLLRNNLMYSRLALNSLWSQG